jgi:type IV pilus assembly protein PilA
MKTNLKYNLLKHLNDKKSEKGFTLIELLVVIIIIGILSAIALPAFLNQAAKARQSEAKQTIGALNRGQQAYRLEQANFASTIANLALGVSTDTNNFGYASSAVDTGIADGNFSSGPAVGAGGWGVYTQVFANAKDTQAVRAYAGAVAASKDVSGNATTITVLCEQDKPLGQAGQTMGIQYNTTATTVAATLACVGALNTL